MTYSGYTSPTFVYLQHQSQESAFKCKIPPIYARQLRHLKHALSGNPKSYAHGLMHKNKN